MRAMLVNEFGGPERLTEVTMPDPVAGPGEVVISLAAAGVNRADLLARSGRYHGAGRPPLLLGFEGAGTVAAVGEGVSEFHIGQRVLATGEMNHPGFYAERAAVSAAKVVAVPDGVDLIDAAALPSAWFSAWYCLRHLAVLQAGETILIHAGASGVGSAAIQIALDSGATVIATAGSPEKRDWVKNLGAQHVLDSDADLVAEVRGLTSDRGADVVLDTVGGQTFADSLRATAYAGRVVALANVALASSTIDTRDFYPKNIRILGFQVGSLTAHGYDPRPDLEALLRGIADGRFVVPIDSVHPLADAAKAHQHVEDRANRGKVMLKIAG